MTSGNVNQAESGEAVEPQPATVDDQLIDELVVRAGRAAFGYRLRRWRGDGSVRADGRGVRGVW
ncbi:hypothetical protein [Streptomyces sp. MAR4 CNX-425]|uniref:hypothetical protein n=1 Tax=Streptomyces sp. MAR4 CNX-425 TaxID=3406343 RepID=UPI003B501152